MILAILGLFLKALPGPILGYLERKAASQNETLRIEVQREIELRNLQRGVLLKEADHWIAWLPRFVLAMSVSLYYGGVFLVSTFGISWTILQVPNEVEAVGVVVVGALFLEKVTRIVKR